MGAIDAFQDLNLRQREAARAPSNPLLIIAGAGTGKTNTLAHRAARGASWRKRIATFGCPGPGRSTLSRTG